MLSVYTRCAFCPLIFFAALVLICQAAGRAADSPRRHPAASTSAPAATQPTVSEFSLGRTDAFKEVRGAVLSRDAKRLAFIGVRGEQQYVVCDGVESPPFEWVMPDSLTLAPSGAGVAYCVQTSKQTFAVVNGKQGKGYYAIERDRVIYSPDASRFAYCASGGRERRDRRQRRGGAAI